MSITGFDNIDLLELSIWANLKLTTIDGNTQQIGREVVRLLSQIKIHEERSPLQVIVKPKLIVGNSITPPK